MTGRSRVLAAIQGKPVDRVPIALWRHFPPQDQKAQTPAASYHGDDWGLRAGYKPNPEGVRHITERPIKKPADWGHLKTLDVTSGVYGRELHALRVIREGLPDVLML